MKQETRNKLNNVLKGLILSKEQKAELVEVFEEVGGGNKNNIYYLYNKLEDGQINWYNTDNKLLFTTTDRFIQFPEIDDITFENYFNCSLNDFHNIYDKIIVTNLDTTQTVILNKIATSRDGYYGIFYICGMDSSDLPIPLAILLINRTTDATNYISVMGSFS